METVRTIRVVAAVIEQRRPLPHHPAPPDRRAPAALGVPRRRVEETETDAAALKREVRHRLGVEIEVGQLISFVSHPYERYVVDLYLYECPSRAASSPRWPCTRSSGSRAPSSISYPFTPADEASMNKLLGMT